MDGLAPTSVAASAAERVILYAVLIVASAVAALNIVGAVAVAISATLGNRVDVALLAQDERPGVGIVDWIAIPEVIVRADFSATTRVMLATADTLVWLTAAAIAASVAFLCLRIVRGQGFGRSLTNAAAFAGASLSIGGLMAQGLGGFAKMLAAEELQGKAGVDLPVAFVFDGVPIAAGVATLLIALVLELGQRMQTRVIELEKETRGLV